MKFSLNIKRKRIPWISTLLLLILSMAIVDLGKAQNGPVLSVEPAYTVEPEPGESFLVNITVANITGSGADGLWAAEFKLWYDPALINATEVTRGPIWGPNPFVAVNDLTVPGRVWWGVTLIMEPSFTGSGTVATINFTALAMDTTLLYLNETILGDHHIPSQPIAHTTEDASVTVVPEFPTAIILPLLVVASLVAALMGKKAWSRKRRSPPVA